MTHLCGLCERNLTIGYLCPGCTSLTVERLAALPGLYNALALFLQPGARGSAERVATSKAEPPLPVAEDPLSLRSEGGMVTWCEDWRSAMHDTLGWPEARRRGPYEQRLARAVRGLRDNVLWIADGWEQAGTFAQELLELHGAATSIVDPSDPADRPKRMGYCPTRVDGVLCGAVVSRRPGQTTPRCAWCSTEWPSTRWLEFRAAQSEFEAADAA